VARDAADVVLTDDDFCSIVNAIEEGKRIVGDTSKALVYSSVGRLIFDNLRKIIAYTLAHLLPEIVAIAVTLLFGFPPAMNSLMILSVDLGTEVRSSSDFSDF
jgi:sodium/potassium-transporting ATPase subunit alpha